MINIQNIDHVVLRVVDLATMIRFYSDVLGARLEKEQADIGLHQLRIGTSLIDLAPVTGKVGGQGGAAPGREGRNVDHICFRVCPWDSNAILTHLRAYGLAGEVASRYGADGDGPSIYITDPEGNILELKGPPWPPERPNPVHFIQEEQS